MTRYLAIAAALLLTLAAPFALRPDTRITEAGPEDTLVILTPHSESIRREFSHAFGEYTQRVGSSVFKYISCVCARFQLAAPRDARWVSLEALSGIVIRCPHARLQLETQ